MAHTNQTPNYGLSEFVGSDKPAWLIDYNGDMEKIDLGMKAAQDVADAAKSEADQGATDIAAVTITANSADAKASGAVSDLADAYDATSTYNVGDFVIYNNILYRCITAITVPESFDGTHWARTTVEEIITQINNELHDTNSWVPVLYYRNGTTPLSYTRTNAKVIKIGHLVFVTARLEVTSVGNGSGLLVRDYSGTLPYTPNSAAMGNIEFQGKMFPMALNANGTEMFVGKGTTTGDAGSTDITAGACVLSIVYTVD